MNQKQKHFAIVACVLIAFILVAIYFLRGGKSFVMMPTIGGQSDVPVTGDTPGTSAGNYSSYNLPSGTPPNFNVQGPINAEIFPRSNVMGGCGCCGFGNDFFPSVGMYTSLMYGG